MRKRIASIVLSVCLCLTLLPTAAFAEGDGSSEGGGAETTGVSYLYYNESTGKMTPGTKAEGQYTVITNESTIWGESGADTWYVVEPTDGEDGITINSTVALKGNVHLILCDGAKLTVNGKLSSTNKLHIYGQTKGNGKLTVTNNDFDTQGYSYGIYTDSALYIHGGNISATSGSITTNNDTAHSFGINAGGLMKIYGGTVTAKGGDVTANSTYAMSAGVRVSSKLTVSNASLTATAGNATGTNGTAVSYGIHIGKELNITSGTINATAGNATSTSGSASSYGIYAYGLSDGMTVSGGTVTVRSGEAANSRGVSVSNNLTVSGGSVKLPAGSYIGGTLKVENDIKLADLLPKDGQQYGFKVDGTWNDDTDKANKSLSKVTVNPLPVQSVTITSDKTSYVEGDTVTLTATVTQPTGKDEAVSYIWFKDNTLTENMVSGAGTDTLTLTDVTVGDYTYICEARADDYNKKDTISFSVVEPVYSISADTTTLDFGTLYTGYTAPAAKTVTITNTGNVTLDLTQMTETTDKFEIGTLSEIRLKPNETATFTVQPKSDLEVGTYNETITVQRMSVNDGNSTNVRITASFAVTNKPSGSSGGGSVNPSYPVTTPKADNGSVKINPSNAKAGDTVTVTVTPDEGYTIDTITVLDKNGKKIEVTDKGNGKYSFTMPKGKVTVEATFTEEAAPLPVFSDVSADSYYHDAVLWAAKNGITGGTTATTFSPDDGCGRGQLVTFLWRVAGCPAAEYEMNFSDVGSSYYTEAVRWAASLGIVGGYGNGQFGAEDTITREQMAVILYRFAQHTGMDTTQGGMAVREYKDYESVSDYAVAAIQWAVNAGVMQGYDGNLMPGQPCTRAQIVTMLYRLLGA